MSYFVNVYSEGKDEPWWGADHKNNGQSVECFGDKNGVLMQYTGLKDRNGKEMWEGDIVKDWDGPHHFCVAFADGCFWAMDGREGVEELGINPQHWTVVGNIYENRELVKL